MAFCNEPPGGFAVSHSKVAVHYCLFQVRGHLDSPHCGWDPAGAWEKRAAESVAGSIDSAVVVRKFRRDQLRDVCGAMVRELEDWDEELESFPNNGGSAEADPAAWCGEGFIEWGHEASDAWHNGGRVL